MGTGFLKRKKEARAMQDKIGEMRSRMESMEVEGTSGNGLVKITLGGDNSMKKLAISKTCVDPEDVDGLQDLIKAAYENARKKLEAQSMQGMQGFSGLPGF